MSTSKRTKQADEMFCRSCGKPIKMKAELCPHCGVRNERAGSSSSTRVTSPRSPPTVHDPSQYDTTVSNSWWYGIVGSILLWLLLIVLSGSLNGGTIIGLLMLAAWILMPVATYYDTQFVRANSTWNPNTVVWVILNAIWLVNIVTGLIYLYRRHETVGEP